MSYANIFFWPIYLCPNHLVCFIFTSIQPIQDPDPFIACDLMDGRDAFLSMARERHYEFSSFRRAKFSSMAMLYELHTQSQDKFVYTCNSCKNNVETRYHCTQCDVSIVFRVRTYLLSYLFIYLRVYFYSSVYTREYLTERK